MFNFNVGVLGHVDSGKTSLVKALSTTASTAAFDKNPQSKERGITLDLGFSSFIVDRPAHINLQNRDSEDGDKMQITLVDCPGHASLIRTIIGGSQIIDLMLLVVDVVKGMQTQTAECLVIGEILCDKMIVVLNKVDLIPEPKRAAHIEKMMKRMLKTLEKTRFADCPVVAVAANPGALEKADPAQSIGVASLIDEITAKSFLPARDIEKNAIFSVDHCFSIRGQGTVMTGTILRGKINVNDNIEIPHLKVTKKVKSMQMFRKPVVTAQQGDRLGVCVTQFDPALFERGYVCTPSTMSYIYASLVSIHRIAYYKLPITSKQKFHVTMGHDTVMATLHMFAHNHSPEAQHAPDFTQEFDYKEELNPGDSSDSGVYALLEFERAVVCTEDALFIGSKLDLDVNTQSCRIAFHGKLLKPFSDQGYRKTELSLLKVFKTKERRGIVERMVDDYTLIGRNLFKKETNIQSFVGMKVSLSTGEIGCIEGSFGQSGKFKVTFRDAFKEGTRSALAAAGKKKSKASTTKDDNSGSSSAQSSSESIEILLRFKRFIYDPLKSMIQS